MGLYYTSFKKKKRNKLPLTPELLEARRKHRKYLISLGIDPDRKISRKNFRVVPNWWETDKTAPLAHSVEQLICNQQVVCSNRTRGTTFDGTTTIPSDNWRLRESKKFTIAPAYNKGGYQVISKDNIKNIGK